MSDSIFEIKLKKGDCVVCICKSWSSFTLGKKYILYSDQTGTLLPVEDDFGNMPLPSYSHPGGTYFLTLDKYREEKIEEILNG